MGDSKVKYNNDHVGCAPITSNLSTLGQLPHSNKNSAPKTQSGPRESDKTESGDGGAWENTLKNEFKASIRESIALKQGHRQNTKKIQLFWLCQLKDSP